MNKAITTILPLRKDRLISKVLETQLKMVFKDFIHYSNHYIESFTPNEKLLGDLFLVPSESGIFQLIGHVEDTNSVIVVTRVPSKQGLSQILKIPHNSDVLIVNDTDSSTQSFVTGLYELGVTNLNFILFSQHEDALKKYRKIQYAITPGESQLVPHFIENVIDIGHRMIDSYTMLRIVNKLGMNNGEIHFNLLKYIDLLAEPKTSLKGHFTTGFLQMEMLKSYIHDVDEAMLLCDINYHVVYANKEFRNMFQKISQGHLSHCFDKDLFKMLSAEDFHEEIVSINTVNYQVSRHSIDVPGGLLGHCIVFRNEKTIRAMEEKLSDGLTKTGYYAKHSFQDILHNSECMKKCIKLAQKAAKSEHSIVISGESGTGKELFVQSIHNYSSRNKKPFVAINCAAMPENLLESELFGYESGAFTGARKNGKLGLFEQANGGSLFLDEIGEIPLPLQAKLLRVLQEKQIMRIGSDKVININVRIITATNKNLIHEVRAGRFREDLYYRINTIPITLPSLRERGRDVLILAKKFLGDAYSALTQEDLNSFLQYKWPGNVRELQNAIHYYQTMQIFNFNQEHLTKDIPANHKTTLENTQIVLQIIAENTQQHHGIGRTAIFFTLKEKDIHISDQKLRGILMFLNKQGYITTGKGRAGNKITTKGQLELEK